MMLVTMLTWALVALMSLLVAHGVILGRLSLGLGALAAFTGTGLSILYVILAGPAGFQWAAVGCAVVGFVVVSIGAYGLLNSDANVTTSGGQRVEESSALWAGLLLPFFMVVALMSLYTAVHGVTSY